MLLNLGCASHPLAHAINVDRVRLSTTQLVFDACQPFPLVTASVDAIVCRQMMQYLPPSSVFPFLSEVWRVLKPLSTIDIFVPRAPTDQAFCDPSSQSFYTLTSFELFVAGHPRCEFARPFNGFTGQFASVSAAVCTWTGEPHHQGEWLHAVLRALPSK